MSGQVKNPTLQKGQFTFEWEKGEDDTADASRSTRVCACHLEAAQPIVNGQICYHYSGDKGHSGGVELLFHCLVTCLFCLLLCFVVDCCFWCCL